MQLKEFNSNELKDAYLIAERCKEIRKQRDVLHNSNTFKKVVDAFEKAGLTNECAAMAANEMVFCPPDKTIDECVSAVNFICKQQARIDKRRARTKDAE